MKTLTRGRETVAYAEAGEGKRAIVLVHNLMCDHAVFDASVAELALTCRTVSVDVRGHGESSAHEPYEIEGAAADVAAILDAEGIEEALMVGLSVGASIALELALVEPARVKGAVLLAPCGAAATRAERVRDALLARTVGALGLRGELAVLTARALFGPTFRARSPEVVDAWRAKVAALTPRFAAHALGAWSRRRDVLEDLRRVTAPVTVVVGEEDDRCPPAEGARVCDALPNARLVRLANAGHTLPVEQPAAVTASIRDVLNRAGWA